MESGSFRYNEGTMRMLWITALTLSLSLVMGAQTAEKAKPTSTATKGQDKRTQAADFLKQGRFNEAIVNLELALKEKPTDTGIKLDLAKAHRAYGDKFFGDNALAPMQKYPNALRQYRKAVSYNAADSEAKQRIAMIEQIYRSLNRPIPE
jgi:Tfp pilus assembly protein PilF